MKRLALALFLLTACAAPDPAPSTPAPSPSPVAGWQAPRALPPPPARPPQPPPAAKGKSPAAKPAEAASPAPVLPPMRLRGTLVTGDRGIASIEVEGESGVRTVPQGRELFGHVLTAVHADRVVFRPRRGEGKVVLYLELDSESFSAPPNVSSPSETPLPAEPDPPGSDGAQQTRLSLVTTEDGTSAVRIDFSGEGPFAEAGFQPGDVVVSIRGEPVTGESQVRGMVDGTSAPGVVVVERNGTRETMTVNRSFLYRSSP